MGLDTSIQIEIDRSLPDAESDSTEKTLRGGRYGEAYVLPIGGNPFHLMADEGSYRVAMTAPGTPVNFAINAAVSETAGNFIHIKNNDAILNNRFKNIYPHYIRLICTTAPTAATALHCFFKLDNVNRWASGGSVLTTYDPNIGGGQATVSQINVGANTTVAPSASAYPVGRAVMRTVIPVVNDEWVFSFGAENGGSAIQLGGLVAQRHVVPMAPVVITPQTNLCMQIWAPGNITLAAAFEVELGFFER